VAINIGVVVANVEVPIEVEVAIIAEVVDNPLEYEILPPVDDAKIIAITTTMMPAVMIRTVGRAIS